MNDDANAKRMDAIRTMLDQGGPVLTIDARWLLARVERLEREAGESD